MLERGDVQQVKQVVLNTKGQIVIPAEMRQSLGLEAGDALLIRLDGRILLLERRDDVLNALAGKYAIPGRSLAAELHRERRDERKGG